MFYKVRHIVTFKAISRLMLLLMCLNVSMLAYGTGLNEQTFVLDNSKSYFVESNVFSSFCTDYCAAESEEGTETSQDNSQNEMSDYILASWPAELNSSLVLFSWLNTNLTMSFQMPCLDQPVTPPEQA